jgi:PAS domain S-box-containing protein
MMIPVPVPIEISPGNSSPGSPEPLFLIVDDDPTFQSLLGSALRENGYPFKIAANGLQALELIGKHRFDLVLLDVMMPGMNGLEVLAIIRKIHPPNQLPVIMVTGVTDSSEISNALNLGANDYICKPIDVPVALARIRIQLAEKQAEDILRQSQQRFEDLLNSIEGVVWEADIGKRSYSYISPRAERLLGYPLECWIERPDFWKGIIHPDDLGRVTSCTPTPTDAQQIHQLDYRVMAKNGGTVWVRDIVTVVMKDGRPVKLRGVMLDITDRKEVEKELAAQVNFQQSLIDAIPIPVFFKDRDGRYLGCNTAFEEFTGETRDKIIGKTVRDVIGGERGEFFRKKDLETMESGRTQVYESDRHNRAGELRQVLFSKSVLNNPDGSVGGVIGACLDITERKKNAEALHRSNIVLEQRVEERTVKLASANLALKSEIEQRRRAEDALQQALRRLVDAQEQERHRISCELHDQMGQHLAALTIGLKVLEDLVEKAEPTHERMRQLRELVGTVMQEMHHLAWELRPPLLDDWGLKTALGRYIEGWQERFGIQADFQAFGLEDHRLPSSIGTTIYRIVQEALTNVLKHAQAKQVSVVLECRQAQVIVVVEDDGQGFEAQAVLEQADTKQKLGLLGMQERISLVGGALDIESQPGCGATVFLKIPLPKPDLVPVPA